MNKIVIVIIVGIILLVAATFLVIVMDDDNNTENVENAQQQEPSPTPIEEVEITGTITSVSFENDAAMLEVEGFDGRIRSLRVDDTAEILYAENDAGQDVEPGERIEIPSISYSDIEEGQRVSATILRKGEGLSTIEYKSPVLIYE